MWSANLHSICQPLPAKLRGGGGRSLHAWPTQSIWPPPQPLQGVKRKLLTFYLTDQWIWPPAPYLSPHNIFILGEGGWGEGRSAQHDRPFHRPSRPELRDEKGEGGLGDGGHNLILPPITSGDHSTNLGRGEGGRDLRPRFTWSVKRNGSYITMCYSVWHPPHVWITFLYMLRLDPGRRPQPYEPCSYHVWIFVL